MSCSLFILSSVNGRGNYWHLCRDTITTQRMSTLTCTTASDSRLRSARQKDWRHSDLRLSCIFVLLQRGIYSQMLLAEKFIWPESLLSSLLTNRRYLRTWHTFNFALLIMFLCSDFLWHGQTKLPAITKPFSSSRLTLHIVSFCNANKTWKPAVRLIT